LKNDVLKNFSSGTYWKKGKERLEENVDKLFEPLNCMKDKVLLM